MLNSKFKTFLIFFFLTEIKVKTPLIKPFKECFSNKTFFFFNFKKFTFLVFGVLTVVVLETTSIKHISHENMVLFDPKGSLHNQIPFEENSFERFLLDQLMSWYFSIENQRVTLATSMFKFSDSDLSEVNMNSIENFFRGYIQNFLSFEKIQTLTPDDPFYKSHLVILQNLLMRLTVLDLQYDKQLSKAKQWLESNEKFLKEATFNQILKRPNSNGFDPSDEPISGQVLASKILEQIELIEKNKFLIAKGIYRCKGLLTSKEPSMVRILCVQTFPALTFIFNTKSPEFLQKIFEKHSILVLKHLGGSYNLGGIFLKVRSFNLLTQKPKNKL